MLGKGQNGQQRAPDPASGRVIDTVLTGKPDRAQKIKPRDRRSTNV